MYEHQQDLMLLILEVLQFYHSMPCIKIIPRNSILSEMQDFFLVFLCNIFGKMVSFDSSKKHRYKSIYIFLRQIIKWWQKKLNTWIIRNKSQTLMCILAQRSPQKKKKKKSMVWNCSRLMLEHVLELYYHRLRNTF